MTPPRFLEEKTMAALKTTAQFIEDARAKHGDRYDYSLVDYYGSKDVVQIICTTHGPFPRSPNSHLNGQGCPTCGGKGKKDTATFIADAREKHGDTYDYSQVKYSNNKTKVQIICPIHGIFLQRPNDHLSSGQGCPDCFGAKPKDTATFIADARAKHGDRYDYSQVHYGSMHRHVQIICKIHGPFPQAPYEHITGQGCPDCAGKNMDTARFIAAARAKHGDLYDYSQVRYVSMPLHVQIICKIHGPFPQSPLHHIHSGRGCPTCGRKRTTNAKRRYHRLRSQARFAKYVEEFLKMPNSGVSHESSGSYSSEQDRACDSTGSGTV
jgi:hypothetical protein